MCGLFGAFRANGCLLPKISSYMWQGLYISGLRGMGGTGVGIAHTDYGVDMAKSHASVPFFLYSEEWEWAEKNMTTARVVLGHTRSPTGNASVTSKNAHPFITDKDGKAIMQIHNGHVSNWPSLTPNTFAHPVDSAHVCHSLAHKGALETLRSIEGAYVLIWYDEERRAMRMARNSERELYFAQDKAKKYLWFASELDFLAAVLHRNHIDHVDAFWQLDLETLYTFDLTKDVLEPHKEKYEKKPKPVYQNARDGQEENEYKNWWRNQPVNKDFTRPLPKQGDYIWCEVVVDDDKAVIPYPHGNFQDKWVYGHVFGHRPGEPKSLVRINGVRASDYRDRLSQIKNNIPTRITRVERNCVSEEHFKGEPYTYYEVTLDEDETAWEIRKIAQKREADKRRLEAAGRALPVLNNSKPGDTAGACTEPNVGSSVPNASTSVGPGDEGIVGSGVERPSPGPILPSVGGVNPNDKVPGPRCTKISLHEWLEIASWGCALCPGGKILACDIGKVGWFPWPCNAEDRDPGDVEYQMICPCCGTDPVQMEKIAAL